MTRATDDPATAATQGSEERLYGRLHETLAGGGFAVTAEVVPPRGASLAGIRRVARAIRDWVDAANITDGQTAEVRLASWAGCLGLLRESVEPVMQLQCRDRNRIALQADLLGAAAVGIPNVLLMTGDDARAGDEPDAKPVFDLDSLQLLRLTRTLRDEGRLLAGRRLSVAPRWFIGAVQNPFKASPAVLAAELGRKIEAGAQFIQTQFVFDLPLFARWLAPIRDLGLDRQCHIIASVGPIRTRRGLDYMLALPGVHIPESIIKRLRGVPDERLAAEAIALCAETIQELRETPGVAGVHVIAARQDELLPQLLAEAGIGRRARAGGAVRASPERPDSASVESMPGASGGDV